MVSRSLFGPTLLLLLTTFVLAQTPASDLSLRTKSLPDASIQHRYSATIEVTGGTPPLQWRILRGKLPPGLTLQDTSGIVSGTPTAPGNYNFSVIISDASAKSITSNFLIRVADYLSVRWVKGPSLDNAGNTLSGAVEVANSSRDTFDQTVIIMAVNEFGRATALGYERFNLAPGSQQTIPYSSLLPNGHYIVHVDAVAEIAPRRVIRRARLQTPQPITVDVNR